jgi:L-alanine-DL-glutamate epimerase-like enolase superfamily enzyme
MDHWEQLAELPLEVESVAYGRLDPGPGFGEAAHSSRLVRLTGAGHEGLGEDITLFLGGTPPQPELAGRWTLGELCAHLDRAEQWPGGPPEWDMPAWVSPEGAKAFESMAVRWRNWAFESAALDLALAQAGRPLHEVIGREPRPVTYVNSLGLGDPPSAESVLRRLERYPRLRFKLDAAVAWTPEVIAALAGTGAVHTLDCKGRYGLEVDREALPALYERLLDAFPDALIEDPHDLPEVAALVEPHAARVSYDAPIHTVADLDAVPVRARTFNVKPSRVGRLRDLFALYDACESRGFAMYGGGMGELGVARGQIQLLAAMFSPDGPNDIAPPGFNALDPAPGLPESPLDPDPAPAGFRRRPDA